MRCIRCVYRTCTEEDRLSTNKNFIQTQRVSASAFIRGIYTPNEPFRKRVYPFSKRFLYREIYRYIHTFVLLHVRPCAFFTCYCPTGEKLGSTINFFVVRFFVPVWHVVLSFFRKIHEALLYKFAKANYTADFGNEENISRSSRSAIELYCVTELVGQMPWHL